jgi:hypothetical protein
MYFLIPKLATMWHLVLNSIFYIDDLIACSYNLSYLLSILYDNTLK